MLTLFFIINNTVLAKKIEPSSNVQLTESEKQWIEKNPILTFGSDSNWVPYIVQNNEQRQMLKE